MPMQDYDVTVMCSDGSREVVKTHASTPIAAFRAALNAIEADWEKEYLPLVEGLRLPIRPRSTKPQEPINHYNATGKDLDELGYAYGARKRNADESDESYRKAVIDRIRNSQMTTARDASDGDSSGDLTFACTVETRPHVLERSEPGHPINLHRHVPRRNSGISSTLTAPSPSPSPPPPPSPSPSPPPTSPSSRGTTAV